MTTDRVHTTRAERQERVREEIIEAAAEAIARRGFHGMSMRELAKATERSLAGFYNYFASKEALLFALHTRAFETLVANAEALLAAVSDPVEQLYLFIAAHVGYFMEHPNVMRVLVAGVSPLEPEQRRVIRQLKDRHFALARDIIRPLFARGARLAGVDGEPDAAEVDRATYAVFGMMNWIYGWYDPGQHGTATDVTRTIHRMTLCGLLGGEAQYVAVAGPSPTSKLDMVRLPSLIRRTGTPEETS